MSYPKRFVAYLKWASAPGPCPDARLPEALASAGRVDGRDEAANEERCALVAPFLEARFLAENVDGLEELLDGAPEEIAADRIRVAAVRFEPGANTPKLKVEAFFTLPFAEDVTEDQLDEWEEDHDDPIGDGVVICWTFADLEGGWDGWLGEYEGSSMQMLARGEREDPDS